MTNKLPVVGKGYRHKETGNKYCLGKVEIACSGVFIHILGEPLYLDEFWSIFKELPEDNLQKEPLELVMDYMQKRTNQIDQTRKDFKAQYPDLLPDDNLQEAEEVKVNEKANRVELETALEYAKDFIWLHGPADNLIKLTKALKDGDEIIKKMFVRMENLVNALEAEKAEMNLVTNALKNGIEQMKDFNSKLDKKYPMSKPEPKIDMKEEFVDSIIGLEEIIEEYEKIHGKFRPLQDNQSCVNKALEWYNGRKKCVEPLSIWKDASELPKTEISETVFIRYKDGDICEALWDGKGFKEVADNIYFKTTNLKDWCYLTNFINSFEQMQKDIEQFEERIKKLEGK